MPAVLIASFQSRLRKLFTSNGPPFGVCNDQPMLEIGARIPDVPVWQAIEEPQPLAEVLGSGLVLLLFYLWDWSPT